MDWRARVEYVERVLGYFLRKCQGPLIPIRMLLRLIAAEGKRDGLSDDFVLCEVGWASVPLAVAWRYNVDPFDDASAAWLAVQEAEHDAGHYLDVFDTTFADDRADLVWVVLLDYSIGTRAAEFVVRSVEGWIERTWDQRQDSKTFRGAACLWTQKALHEPGRELRHYGRQTRAQVYARICKDAARVRQIYGLPDSFEGTAHACAVARDALVLPFPDSKELRKAAEICNRMATPEEHLTAWKMVRRYIDRRFGRG